MKKNAQQPESDETFLASGKSPLVERLIFKNRLPLVIFILVIALGLGYQAAKLRPDASFLKMIPTNHPYVQNFLENIDDLKGLGNSVRMAIETTEGDIYTAEYMDTLQKINDEVF
jgi:predicted RND superfamily exporter protein